MNSDKIERFINVACKEAQKSTMEKKHGSVLVYRNKIIGSGYNYFTPSSGRIHSKRPDNLESGRFSIHAEVSCIRSVEPEKRKYIPESILIVVRIDSERNYTQSKPCKNCCRVIEKYKIKKIIHS